MNQPKSGKLNKQEAIEEGYQEMSGDEAREKEALEWIEGTLHPNEL